VHGFWQRLYRHCLAAAVVDRWPPEGPDGRVAVSLAVAESCPSGRVEGFRLRMMIPPEGPLIRVLAAATDLPAQATARRFFVLSRDHRLSAPSTSTVQFPDHPHPSRYSCYGAEGSASPRTRWNATWSVRLSTFRQPDASMADVPCRNRPQALSRALSPVALLTVLHQNRSEIGCRRKHWPNRL